MGWALSWDLDPLLQYLHLDKYLLQQYIQSNYEGLKISLCICILGKLWTKRHQKTKNLIATSQFSGVKAAYWAWFLHTAPPRGWGQYINHFFQLLDGSNPTLIQFKGPTCSSSPHAYCSSLLPLRSSFSELSEVLYPRPQSSFCPQWNSTHNSYIVHFL